MASARYFVFVFVKFLTFGHEATIGMKIRTKISKFIEMR